MKIVTKPIPYQLNYPLISSFQPEETLFFDIETTGLSALHSYVYLISCASFKEGTWILTQWLMEKIDEEQVIIQNFFTFLSSFRLLIHYNGSGFDLPYLQKKCIQYHLNYNFDSIQSFDLYQQLIPYKKKLPVQNLKLQTIEKFIGIKRKDTYQGGELISVYTEYVGRKGYEAIHNHETQSYQIAKNSGLPSIGSFTAQQLEDILLLHNAEDVMDLLCVMNALAYVDLFQGKLYHYHIIKNSSEMEITANLEHALPTPLQYTQFYGNCKITFLIQSHQLRIIIPISHLTLKFFFADYKNYYYLTKEDTAVHKSIGEYVDKKYREQAKASTCYIKKEGDFLPQPHKIFEPSFYSEYKDKYCWFELQPDSFDDPIRLEAYVQALLSNVVV